MCISLLMLAGCGRSESTTLFSVGDYSFEYKGNIQLSESSFVAEGLEDVVAIYEES